MRKPWLTPLAPEGWGEQHQQPALPLGEAPQDGPQQFLSAQASRSAWARLLAKIYEIDALHCSRCGSPMKVLALITDSHEVRKILLHLIKTGVAPPGREVASPS
jgi:hypothetical protein